MSQPRSRREGDRSMEDSSRRPGEPALWEFAAGRTATPVLIALSLGADRVGEAIGIRGDLELRVGLGPRLVCAARPAGPFILALVLGSEFLTELARIGDQTARRSEF